MEMTDGSLRISASHLKTNLMGTWYALDGDAIRAVVEQFGPDGKNRCQNCGKVLIEARPSIERQMFGMPFDYVWVDWDGSEECPLAAIGYHFGPGEKIAE